MDINNLFQNPIIKKAALGSLITAMRNNNVRTAVIKFDPSPDKEDDPLTFEFHGEDMVVIPEEDLDYYKTLIQNNL